MTLRNGRSRLRLGILVVTASALLAAGDGVGYERPGAKTVAAAQQAPARSPVLVIVHMTNVTGTVASVGDDATGPTQAVGIVSPDSRIYLIGDEGLGKDLKQFVGKTVTVAAEVKHDVDGWPYLAVEWFRILES
jgi:hypothetical protein